MNNRLQHDPQGLSKHKWFLLMCIVAITFLSYSPILSNQFTNWDDNDFIVNNTDIQELSWTNIKTIFTKNYVKVYVPLTLFSWSLEHQLVGYEPFLYYLDNLLLHCLVSSLVFLLALRLGLSTAAAFLGALLFGVHPVHVESVAWATERKDVLFAALYMLSLIQYVAYLKNKKIGPYLLTIAFGFLSILAKPAALSLPFALAALDYYHKRKINKFFFLDKIPFFIYIIPIASLTFFQHAQGGKEHIAGGTLSEAIPIFFYSSSFYVRKFIGPLQLIPNYQLPEPINMAHGYYIFCAAVVLAYLFLLFYFRKNRLFIFSNLFFLGAIFYYIRFGTAVRYASVVADRFMYIASVGLCIFAGQFFIDCLRAVKNKGLVFKRGIIVLIFMIFGALMAKTYTQSKIWQDAITFWSYVIKVNPQYNVKAYVLRANAYVMKDELKMALDDCNSAVRIDPNVGAVYAQRGAIYDKMGFSELAFSDLNKALKLNFLKAYVYVNRAGIYIEKGELDMAIADSNLALELGDSDAKAYNVRGKAYGLRGDLKKAIEDFDRSILLTKNDPLFYYDRGYFYSLMGEGEKAVADYSKAITIDPDDALTLDARGGLYFEMQKYDLALNDFNKVLLLNMNYARGYNNRGSVYLARQQLDEALADFNKAIKLDKKYALAYLNRSLVYQQLGKPATALEDALRARTLGLDIEEDYINELRPVE